MYDSDVSIHTYVEIYDQMQAIPSLSIPAQNGENTCWMKYSNQIFVSK